MKSHVFGATEPPLIELTIGKFLEKRASETGEALALVSRHQNIRWNWTEFDHEVNQLATGLLRLGLAPGDRVGIWAPNCAEWALAQFATARTGLILVTINPAYRAWEAEFALKNVGCKALILARDFKTSNYLAMLNEIAPELVTASPGVLQSEKLPDLQSVILIGNEPAPGCFSFGDVLAAPDPVALAKISDELAATDAVNIQFTSGTTGLPKGATLTHRNILNNGYFVGQQLGLTSEDRICIPVPLYHCFGMVMGNLAALAHGAAMIYPEAGFDPLASLKSIAEERCTALYAVPTMFIAMMSHERFCEFDISSLRTGVMAGAPCPAATMQEVIDQMHLSEITICYGMTETSPVSFQSDRNDPLDLRVSTVGRIQPHCEVKIVNTNGDTLDIGEQGELCTRGYSVMQGYWNDSVKTAQVIDAEGWMHTGDIATIDKTGYCRITGRIKDMIIRGGENVYPREIEEFLMTHPQIVESQVFGIPDDKFGEQVVAWVTLRKGGTATGEELRAWCGGRIAHYKVPLRFRVVASFPMTVTGKPQKFVMRDMELEQHSSETSG